MDTIFMNSENSRTSKYHALVLGITIKSWYLLYMGKHKKLIR